MRRHATPRRAASSPGRSVSDSGSAPEWYCLPRAAGAKKAKDLVALDRECDVENCRDVPRLGPRADGFGLDDRITWYDGLGHFHVFDVVALQLAALRCTLAARHADSACVMSGRTCYCSGHLDRSFASRNAETIRLPAGEGWPS